MAFRTFAPQDGMEFSASILYQQDGIENGFFVRVLALK